MENLGNLAEILRARGADSQKGAIRGTIGCGLVLSGQLATDAGYIVECLFIFIGTTANIVMLILPRVLKTLGNIAKGETDQTILQAALTHVKRPANSVSTVVADGLTVGGYAPGKPHLTQ